ncbi:MerR family transcriptional regulator [Rhodococcus rhodnii]|uniref:HTH merR-type domain-containing protein n=2 Tax=Rhodococcus rhodnii TaxID=38312 RepID=R7WNW9_9NOCA|nr:MerR family transcriptional regulator [Rhodococcus rhodnii]EOM77008.1 hypothetical protein Rrhod_1627 [Rhodococcus rhodnii LMG 5362]TXG89916.1 MerR family transcriptional regulator [Rhodococcus rhodnii]
MRIGQMARAAGTTVRAVRHYHRLGLLGEPHRTSNGYRDYTIADLARLMRIRWLAAEGLPLDSVATVLGAADDADRDGDLRTDLLALTADTRRQIALLQRKLDSLQRLLDAVDQGRRPTALPRDLADAFDKQSVAATDPSAALALARERDLVEMLAISGEAPSDLFTWFAGALADPDSAATYRALLRRWGELEGRNPTERTDDIELLAHDLAGHLDGLIPGHADVDTAPSFPGFTLPDVVPDAAQRAVIERAITILAAGEQAR